jgi:predicted DNA-binding transcriptional regulator AlpA
MFYDLSRDHISHQALDAMSSARCRVIIVQLTVSSTNPLDDYLDVRQICAITRRKERKVRRLVRLGQFPPSVLVGSSRLWRRSTVKAWFAAHETPSGFSAPKRRRAR